jgi:hypothetical protein
MQWLQGWGGGGTIRSIVSQAVAKLPEAVLDPAAEALRQLTAEVQDETSQQPEEEEEEVDNYQIPITQTLVEYVQNLALHPSTFINFPIPKLTDASFRLNKGEERHAKEILQRVPELQALRYDLCPRKMTEETFWRIYFLLLLNKTTRGLGQDKEDSTKSQSFDVQIDQKAKENKNGNKTSKDEETEEEEDEEEEEEENDNSYNYNNYNNYNNIYHHETENGKNEFSFLLDHQSFLQVDESVLLVEQYFEKLLNEKREKVKAAEIAKRGGGEGGDGQSGSSSSSSTGSNYDPALEALALDLDDNYFTL